MTRKALGRGLGALIPQADTEVALAEPIELSPGEVPLTSIRPNPFQPRTIFNAEALSELAASIRENGLIQPLVVRDAGDGGFELIAGERRLHACRQAGLTHVPVVIKQATRRDMLQMALVENLQREDLNPIEEAEAYQRLANEFALTQEEIADRVGKSRASVANALRLLQLETDLRQLIAKGTLSPGHARALLSIPSAETRRKIAKEIVENNLSVRDAELRVQGERSKRPRAQSRKRTHPALDAWEERLRGRFATQVRIVGGLARGRVEIHYFSHEDLERVLELAGVGPTL
ncbi:MAG TPA: ParB/RepB/Spo0J family partition protein [Candidatus Eisenbacteria bacterium]|nr:ParB/RepB/Spo0J family partition protein [Candidatus Eisenbacteria bacterium]